MACAPSWQRLLLLPLRPAGCVCFATLYPWEFPHFVLLFKFISEISSVPHCDDGFTHFLLY